LNILGCFLNCADKQEVNMRRLAVVKHALLTVLCGCCVLAHPAAAAVVTYDFNAHLQTGSLAGTDFAGSLAYDNAASSGIGTEFLPLAALDFSLLGVSFSAPDIKQGGQAILQNGDFSYFTAAFFPPPPNGAAVSDIAFGFGGPGVIGYTVPPGLANGGMGTYATFLAPVDEPSAWTLVLGGVIAIMSFRLRSQERGGRRSFARCL
jgi:hypothetical protein